MKLITRSFQLKLKPEPRLALSLVFFQIPFFFSKKEEISFGLVSFKAKAEIF